MKLTRKAFTLVELIIVIAIIAVLSVSAFMVLTKWLGKSRDSRRLGDVGAIERSLTTWVSDYSGNPLGKLSVATGDDLVGSGIVSSTQGFTTYFDSLKDDGFDVLQKVVKDPAGKDYKIAINAGGKDKFAVAATLENDGAASAAVRTNYQAGVEIADADGNMWSGDSIIVDSDLDQITDGDLIDFPYSLTE